MAIYQKTALIGTGLVGPQIGVVLAQGSGEMHVFDKNPEAVDRGACRYSWGTLTNSRATRCSWAVTPTRSVRAFGRATP